MDPGAAIHLATVTYFTPHRVLYAFLQSVRTACARYAAAFPNASLTLSIVDNSPHGADSERLRSAATDCLGSGLACRIICGHGNLGYGAALNRATLGAESD